MAPSTLEPIEWISAEGTLTTLWVQPGASGRFGPPVVIQEEEVPGFAGSQFREMRHGPRSFSLPLFIDATSESAKRTALRTLIRDMDASLGDGRLRVHSPAGDVREIVCRVTQGLELDEGAQDSYPGWQKLVPMFRAFDPYWYETSDTVATYTTGATATFFPIFPLRLSSSQVFADATANNPGDLETWPQWEITGPGSSIVVRNLLTGEFTNLTSGIGGVALGDGEKLYIDTRPGIKTVTKGDGTNLWPYLSTDSALWALGRGSIGVRVEMGGATTSSSVKLTYRPRYLTP